MLNREVSISFKQAFCERCLADSQFEAEQVGKTLLGVRGA